MMGTLIWSLGWSQVTSQVAQSASTAVLDMGDVLGESANVMPSGQGRTAPPAFVQCSAVDMVTMEGEAVTVRLAGRGRSVMSDMMSASCRTATHMGSALPEFVSASKDGLDSFVRNVSIATFLFASTLILVPFELQQ